jgi:hypothetical protein
MIGRAAVPHEGRVNLSPRAASISIPRPQDSAISRAIPGPIHQELTAMADLKMVYEKDAPLDALKGKTVAVIGYGSQGHAHAQNMRDSGLKVIVANRKDSPNGRLAQEHGFNPMPVEDAVKQADLAIITLPDEVQPEVYNKSIKPNLKKGPGAGRDARLQLSFQDHRSAEGRRRHPHRAQGPGSPGPQRVRKGRRRAVFARRLPGRHRQRAQDRAGVGQRRRRRALGHHRDDF